MESAPDVITVLLPLLALCALPKHVNFPYSTFNEESQVMTCKEANTFLQNNEGEDEITLSDKFNRFFLLFAHCRN